FMLSADAWNEGSENGRHTGRCYELHCLRHGATKRWTVVIHRAAKHITLHPAVVVAGVQGAPRIPVIPNKELFRGINLHSSESLLLRKV
ncbi:hypothetical protein B0H11DRAFT_2003920, partial [Mycena galericulata]